MLSNPFRRRARQQQGQQRKNQGDASRAGAITIGMSGPESAAASSSSPMSAASVGLPPESDYRESDCGIFAATQLSTMLMLMLLPLRIASYAAGVLNQAPPS
ncbi:unnamed protein product [Parajaminaea phylloscopi]